MTYLPSLCAILALTSAQDTIIQNKNVNIIVNVDPEQVAKELWKVIEARLNNSTSHPTNSWNAIKDLEKVVASLVSPNRRSSAQPSAHQVANELDRITRRALSRGIPNINLMDEEIMTRDIVADMMVSLKMIQSRAYETDAPVRRMYEPATSAENDDSEDYVNVRIKIRRRDILDALH
ncbi:hypothetical protein EAI_04564 [Harpegnathos saltator]|uniref:Uncharacterized protein n=3 Tax=Harpegnathos saltator TaxID=610380 RepID=E2C8Y0_HARSA|nr:hypothetical protein EAI_04564 [Harpegnathos saltator]